MRKADVLQHFGGVRKVANLLNLSTQAVYAWEDIVPERVALKLERITEGKLKYDESEYLTCL